MNKITNTVIKYFSEMDVEMLSIILDDNRTYQDATKVDFLNKVDNLFKKFKNSGDTFLTPHLGNCCSILCPNNGCNGFRLVGNKSTNNTAFCFEEEGDDLKDLFICNDFKTSGDEIFTMKFLAFNIDEDEEAGFEPSVDYLILLQKSEQAIEEIINKEVSFLSFDEITSWHIKHFELWETVLDDLPVTQYGKFYNFIELYVFTIRLIKYFKSHRITKSIKIWARKTNFENTNYYRVITNKKDDFVLDFFEIKVHKEDGLEYIKISQDYNIFLLVKDIEEVATLKNIIDSFRKFSMLAN